MRSVRTCTVLCFICLMATCVFAARTGAARDVGQRVSFDGVNYRLESDAAYIESFDYSAARIEVHAIVEGLPMKTKAFYCTRSGETDAPERVREVVLCEGIEVLADRCFCMRSEVGGTPVECTAISLVPMADGFTRHADASEMRASKIVLCEGVEVIAGRCFAGFQALENVSLPQSLCEIGPEAFLDAASLQSIRPPHEVKMGKAAFKRSGLTQFDVPEGVQYLSDSLFENAPLENVTLPESLTGISERAFSGTRLRRVALPMRLDYLPGDVFDGAAFLGPLRSPKAAIM